VPRPSTACSSSFDDSQLAIPEAGVQSLFVLPADKMWLKNTPELQRMEKFAESTKHFLQCYDRAADFIGPYKSRALKKPASMIAPVEAAEVFKYNLGDLGANLFLNSKSVGRDFCLTFCEYQRLVQGHYYHSLDALFSIADEPVPLAEFAQILPINDISKAVKNLTQQSTASVFMSDLYLHNIYEVQANSGALKGLTRKLEKVTDKLHEAEAKLRDFLTQRNDWQAKLEQAAADDAVMQRVQNSEDGMKKYYQEQLDQVSRKLAEAEKQEHDYTYRMYGFFRNVWENDVKLAKEKVQRFTANKMELERKIMEVNDSNNRSMLDSCAQKTVEAAVKAREMLKQWDDAIERANVDVKKWIDMESNTVRQIAVIVKRQGGGDVDTFLDTMDAMKAAGKSSSTAVGGGKVVVSGWVRDLNFIGLLVTKMGRARTLDKQLQAYHALRAFTSNPDNMLCMLLQHAQPISDIGDSSGSLALPERRTTALINLDDVDVGDIEEDAPLPELEDIPVPVVSDAEVAAAAEHVTEPIAEAFAEQLDSVDAPASVECAVGASDDVFVDDLANEFEDS